ncbi:hypothetical protein BASA50_010774 [Batrachochytrium salamandrivorans]|uniref:MABP domain-containing protein n=1 Tax=Batrachochytrium salamandrivorans TaxID=1357716 RepID=A0ABQ8EXI2_9FUNG|nr:hypothetical protein BASA50_010774 [Batrachochytrium salamandrivorans]KAH9263237.1 hypothetical protein BASA83_013404 [Batrachochytrium salamandrivorans]
MILKAPLFTPIAPMLTDCGIISLDAHAILARVRLTVKATTLKTPLRTLLLPSTIPSHSNSWFWTRRSRSLIRFVHPNMSLFHFNIPISTNGLFHNSISTNSSITSSNINRSIPNTPFINTSITTTSTTIPITPTIAEIRHQRSKYALERTFQVWGKSKLACSYVQANHASSAKFLRSPALSTGQAIGASLLSLARCGGLWDYPRALKAGLLHPTATDPDQLGSPSLCILCHAHLDCKPMAHLVVDCTHPTVFFARVDTQLLQAINDTRVQIFDCTLHTTTTTITTTTTPASPSLSTATINSNPDSTGTSAIWDSMDIHTPIDNHQYSPRPTSQSSPSSPSSPSDFSIFSFSHFSPDTHFEPPISVAHSEIPRQAQDTVEENPTASRTTITDTHTAAISSTPTPTHISYIGSDDILTVLLGGSLPGTNTAGNTEAHPGQQWLTATKTVPSLFRQAYKQCKRVFSMFGPCGSSALSEEPSVGLNVVAAASTETPLEIQQSGEPNNMHTVCMPKQIPAYDNPDRIAGLRKLTKMDSGVQVVMPVKKLTVRPKEVRPKEIHLDWHIYTRIVLDGVHHGPTVCTVGSNTNGTLVITGRLKDSPPPYISLNYHTITSLEIVECSGKRSPMVYAYDYKVVMSFKEKKGSCEKDRILVIWVQSEYDAKKLTRSIYNTLSLVKKFGCKITRHS